MFVTHHHRPPEEALIFPITQAERLEARRAAIREATERYGPQVAAWWIANSLGMTQEEIGIMSQVHPRTVRRYIRMFRGCLVRVYQEPYQWQ